MRKQKKSLIKEGDTSTGGSAADTAETAEAAEGSALGTAITGWKECLQPAQLAIPSFPPLI